MLKRLVVICAVSFGANASSVSIVEQGLKGCDVVASPGAEWDRGEHDWKYKTKLTVQCENPLAYDIVTDTSSLASSEVNVDESVTLYIDNDEACNEGSDGGYSSSSNDLKHGVGFESWDVCIRFDGYDLSALTGHVNIVFSNTVLKDTQPDQVSHIHFEHNGKEPDGSDLAGMDIMLQTLTQDKNVVFLVQGHTSLVGDFNYNEKLAKARVEAVKKELLSYPWVSQDMVYVATWGEMRPSSLQVGAEAEKVNRRVSVSAYKKQDCWPKLLTFFSGDFYSSERTLCK